jgi:hypothetical protein
MGNLGPVTQVVSATSFETVDGQQRKKIKLGQPGYYQFAWIDGIGDSARGLLNVDVGWEGAHYELVCQHDSAGIVFTNIKPPYTNDPTGHLHICDSIQSVDPCQVVTSDHDLLARSSLLVYPNPAGTTVTYYSPLNKSTVEILNAFGQELFQSETAEGWQTISVEELPEGMYFLKITRAPLLFFSVIIVQR